MFKSYGKLEINNGVRIVANFDLCRYYKRLFEMAHWNTVNSQLPKHMSHISIYLPDIHGQNIDVSSIKYLNGKKIEFEYNPVDITISTKNVWMKVKCEEAMGIKNKMKIIDENFWGFHLTIANFKGL